MRRTHFAEMPCSIARTVAVVGEPWSPLILRDVWVGIRRFDELQAELGISRRVLAERLRWLTSQDLLEQREYSMRPPRSEYTLTEKGLDFCGVLTAISAWGIAGQPVTPGRPSCYVTTPAAPTPTPSSAARYAARSSTPTRWTSSRDPAHSERPTPTSLHPF
jgi:DNA-binding HxlR family transcriptional regulator